MLIALGCGDKDLNKDIKPIDANATRPKAGEASGPKGNQPAAKAQPPMN